MSDATRKMLLSAMYSAIGGAAAVVLEYASGGGFGLLSPLVGSAVTFGLAQLKAYLFG